MKNKASLRVFTILAFATLLLSETPAADPAHPALLPLPAKLEWHDGVFKIAQTTSVAAGEFPNEAKLLNLPIDEAAGTIRFVRATALPKEGYELEALPAGVTIRASTAAGAFYGVQTFLQLRAESPESIPCVTIHDEPRLAWRGLMLDVSRHFFDKSEVETVLDQMALLKLNVFHWHLTDDHGWRVEIKKYPKLTSVGAWRAITPPEKDSKHNKDGLYGGFYTQDEIREVVAYAAARHIEIVPEIDMPGHFSAAMTAYPDLAPNNGWKPLIGTLPKSPGERCGAMCVAKEQSVVFCKEVLEELLTLFPSKYIHIGGDEVFYEQWEACPVSVESMKKLGCKDMADMQVHFTNDMVGYLESKGRKAIIWNNLYRQTVDKRAINQFWRDMNPARSFANAGYTVLVSHSAFYYFDHHPALEKAYVNDPISLPNISPEGRERIPGLEGCAWSERIPNMDVLYQHMYPLLFAFAETGWSPQQSKDWTSFRERVTVQQTRFEKLGVHGNPKGIPSAGDKAGK